MLARTFTLIGVAAVMATLALNGLAASAKPAPASLYATATAGVRG